jgi:predicted HicB family RNase H-like nuclease
MTAMMYKGFAALVEFDPQDVLFVGRVTGLNDIVGFHASGAEQLIEAFHESVDDYLQTCAQVGKQPEKPYSGKLMFRFNPEIHAKAALAAALTGKSLNAWAEEVISAAANTETGLATAV